MSWITLYSGAKFDFDKPEECEFTLDDIAVPLSHICRFTGHTVHHYSVAQHSVMVADQMLASKSPVVREQAYNGLMHDATEAFLGDVALPLKQILPDYQRLEERIEPVIMARLGLNVSRTDIIKRYDMRAMVTERHALMEDQDSKWPGFEGINPFKSSIPIWEPHHACAVFKLTFVQLAPAEVKNRLFPV